MILVFLSQTRANDHLQKVTFCLQRPPVNNEHIFWIHRVAIVHRFACTFEMFYYSIGLFGFWYPPEE